MSYPPLLLHLRIPFGVYLMPVFLFALSQADSLDWNSTLACFVALHFFLYPASNGYNSYMDQDTGSIGGIKSPPKVPKSMFVLSLILDSIGILLIYFWVSNPVASALALLYVLASRAYSYRKIRIKKFPVLGFLHVSIFQGVVIFLLVSISTGSTILYDMEFMVSLCMAFVLVGAGYPLTQVYQHEQDKKDGVKTLSMLLGIRGTFVFSSILFAALGALAFYYFGILQQKWSYLLLFALCTAPVFGFFNLWMRSVFSKPEEANFENTMRMNNIAAISVNVFFIILIFLEHSQS
jgi:1,4-dihydroxy-2-naphthoate octaprenyltransferase